MRVHVGRPASAAFGTSGGKQPHPSCNPFNRAGAMVVTAQMALAILCLVLGAPGTAAATGPVQLAQGAADVLELGKKALGLGEETPEGSESTGIANGVPFLVRFRDTVGSLEAGAPVLVRGMRMGAVREVKVTFDPATSSFAIPVVIELDPAPFITGEPNEAAATPVHQAIAAMVRVGLRAELAAANLVPGTLAVALEIRPEAAPAELGQADGGPPEIPSVDAPLEPLTAKLERLAARASALPLEKTVAKLDELIAAAHRVLEHPALDRLLVNLAEASDNLVPATAQIGPTVLAAEAMAKQGRTTLTELHGLLERSESLPVEMQQALEELADAARSARVLTDMLERQPEALLRGKGE